MIDTDKYEGHTEGPWEMNTNDRGQVWVSFFHPDDDNGDHHLCRITGGVEADDQLIADAPLLLAEVKRLREIINKAMQQHTVLEMRGQLFESQCIDAEGQYESGQWERDEE